MGTYGGGYFSSINMMALRGLLAVTLDSCLIKGSIVQ